MATDDLNAPLGQDATKKRRFVLPIAVPQVIASALGLFVLIFVAWALLVDDPLGGEPIVVVAAKPDPLHAQPDRTPGAGGTDRKSTRLNSSHIQKSRMPSSA